MTYDKSKKTVIVAQPYSHWKGKPERITFTVTDPEGGKHDLTIEHLERAVDVIFTKETEILKQYLNEPDMLTDCAFIDCAIFGEVTFG